MSIPAVSETRSYEVAETDIRSETKYATARNSPIASTSPIIVRA
jgi:hypothetical protein